ncbi:hypothetical protein RCL_jg8615.t1 [Rhizophagus clarus]|uniref:Uncharacterized protein n=1 Tax=Rhizophagus clarus TaxID=94130 RepID=A0A8H3LYQ3_9GLOM|nr:hypothetical protein RCL_jg8615.t1 [Rhizophagus clarus]
MKGMEEMEKETGRNGQEMEPERTNKTERTVRKVNPYERTKPNVKRATGSSNTADYSLFLSIDFWLIDSLDVEIVSMAWLFMYWTCGNSTGLHGHFDGDFGSSQISILNS